MILNTFRTPNQSPPGSRRDVLCIARKRTSVVAHGLVETLGILSTGVLVHEAGHLAAAKWRRVCVDHVSIGIGPVLLAFSDDDNVPFLLRAIPLGGYVTFRESGRNGTVALDDASLLDKILVTMAGPLANIICTVVLSTMVSCTSGHIDIQHGFVVDSVTAGTSASRSGVMEGDVIRSVNGIHIEPTEQSYRDAMMEFSTSADVELDILRDATQERISIQPKYGRLGMSLSPKTTTTVLAPSTALRRGWKDAMIMTKAVALAILDMVRPGHEHTPHDVTYITDNGSFRGAAQALQLCNVNIAMLMSCPVPPMDGFWVGVYVLETLMKTKFDRDHVSTAGRAGSSLLFALFLISVIQELFM